MKKHVRILVVGGNAAGCAAAAKAKRYNPNADVILFEKSEYISTGTCEMPYVLSGEIPDFRKLLFYTPSAFQQEKGVKVFVKHFVEEIDSKKKQLVVKDLVENKIIYFDYDRLILTTGSKAKTLPAFDRQLKNVFTLKSINDLIMLMDYIKANDVANAIVIGSGYIGIEATEALSKRNIKVKLLEKESRPLLEAEENFSEEILNELRKNNVEFIRNANQVEPVIADDKIVALKLGNEFIKTDLVIVSVGFESDTFLARSAKLELGKTGPIKVDRYLKTSDRFIYAAGDNIEVINVVTGKPDFIPLATHSYALGHIVGENAAGGNLKYEPVVKNISVKIFDKFFVLVGLTRTQAVQNGFTIETAFGKAKNLVGVMSGSNYVIGNVIADRNTKRILGASFLGGNEVSGYADLLSALIKLKVPASTLSKINYNYTPPLSPFINLLSILGKMFSNY
jgi:NADPH-dependent 2,4-dienoyl-CoA reductase/sulfur reductase-like enzyme